MNLEKVRYVWLECLSFVIHLPYDSNYRISFRHQPLMKLTVTKVKQTNNISFPFLTLSRLVNTFYISTILKTWNILHKRVFSSLSTEIRSFNTWLGVQQVWDNVDNIACPQGGSSGQTDFERAQLYNRREKVKSIGRRASTSSLCMDTSLATWSKV